MYNCTTIGIDQMLHHWVLAGLIKQLDQILTEPSRGEWQYIRVSIIH
jgi:hypothetical protein